MAKVLVILADGFEETEAVTVIDILRRGGIEVITASLGEPTVTGNHGISLVADQVLDSIVGHDFDMIVLPGGQPGAENLRTDPRVGVLLRGQDEAEAYIAAICAAPRVVQAAGLLTGKRVTSFPGALDESTLSGVNYLEEAVVVDGRLITSRGPGTAMDFALTLVTVLAGEDVRRRVEAKLMRSAPRC